MRGLTVGDFGGGMTFILEGHREETVVNDRQEQGSDPFCLLKNRLKFVEPSGSAPCLVAST